MAGGGWGGAGGWWLAPPDTRGVDDPLVDLLLPAVPGDLVDDHASQDVVGVRVLPAGAGREVWLVPHRDGHQLRRGVGGEPACEEARGRGNFGKIGGVVIESAGVLQQFPDGD